MAVRIIMAALFILSTGLCLGQEKSLDREILYRLKELEAVKERLVQREEECSRIQSLADREVQLAQAYQKLAEDQKKLAEDRLQLEREKSAAYESRITDLEEIVKGLKDRKRKWWCLWLCAR